MKQVKYTESSVYSLTKGQVQILEGLYVLSQIIDGIKAANEAAKLLGTDAQQTAYGTGFTGRLPSNERYSHKDLDLVISTLELQAGELAQTLRVFCESNPDFPKSEDAVIL